MKHTEGPWKVTQTREFYKDHVQPYQIEAVNGQEGESTCFVARLSDMWGEEAKANARLIAAAPDLLEACKKALHPLRYLAAHGEMPEGAMPSHLPVVELIAAIAKAEGDRE